MKNALVSRDPICIFSDNFGALVDKSIHTFHMIEANRRQGAHAVHSAER